MAYDLSLAHRLALCTEFVRTRQQRGDDKIARFLDAHHIGNAVEPVAVIECEDCNVLAFQGTLTKFTVEQQPRTLSAVFHNALDIFDSASDWSENARILLTDRSFFPFPGKVHGGFAHQLELVMNPIRVTLAGITQRPLFVTGHSQGGGVANLAYLPLKNLGHTPVGVYTFAAPRSGNRAYRDALTGQVPIFRHEYRNDIVPHLPFRDFENPELLDQLRRLPFQMVANFLNRGYVEVGVLNYRSDPGVPVRTEISGDEEAAMGRERFARVLTHAGDWVGDHSMDQYILMTRA